MKKVMMSALMSGFMFCSVFAFGADCSATLQDLESVTQGLKSLKAKDLNGLVKKAADASAEYKAGKNSDALQKLNDMHDKLVELAASSGTTKEKISRGDAVVLQASLDQAIGCLKPGS